MTIQTPDRRPDPQPIAPADGPSRVSVLIVGAGPTGLTLAVALRRYGVDVRLVERRDRLSHQTKASNLMLRSREVLAALGISVPDAEAGVPMRFIAYEVHGHGLGRRMMHQPDTPHPGVLLCGQNRYEEAAAAHLSGQGVAVEFGTRLVDAKQDADGVTATLEGPQGAERVHCDYLVGCDGASGPTRTFTRHDFKPHKTGVAVRQVDCRMTWRRSPTQDQMWLFYFTNGFLAVVPLPGGLYRIATHEPAGRLPSDKPDLPEMQARLRAVSGDDSVTLSDLEWATHTDLSMGIGPGLIDGRIVLAGDSGNPILPNGGQGMNVGIVDAFNLGWKLAAVLGGAPGALPQSYEAERHAIRASLETFQWTSLKYTTLRTPAWLRWLMPRAAEAALNRGGEAGLARTFTQLAEHVRTSPLSLDLAGRRARGLRAGDRVPDVEVVADGRAERLFDRVHAEGWTLLAFTGTDARRDVGAARGGGGARGAGRGAAPCLNRRRLGGRHGRALRSRWHGAPRRWDPWPHALPRAPRRHGGRPRAPRRRRQVDGLRGSVDHGGDAAPPGAGPRRGPTTSGRGADPSGVRAAR